MRSKQAILAAVGLAAILLVAGGAMADVLHMTGGLTSLETVHVGDPSNATDPRYADLANFPMANGVGYGAVAYAYNIGKYEVTAGQYCEFLSKVAATDTYGLYNPNMDTAVNSFGCNIKQAGSSGGYTYSVDADWANRPVNFVSYWDACRFSNWLNNGQPAGAQGPGTTETGAYTLNGYNGYRGGSIQRNPAATWAVTSEDEWYKAAYYKAGGPNAGYWDYPTCSNTAPSNVGSDGYTDPGNHANSSNNMYTIGSPYYRTNVGEFENSASAYGTFDQGGNVWEWNESVPETGFYDYRGIRGGAFQDSGYLRASYRNDGDPTGEARGIGFRVSAVPEPASMAFLTLGGLALLRRRDR